MSNPPSVTINSIAALRRGWAFGCDMSVTSTNLGERAGWRRRIGHPARRRGAPPPRPSPPKNTRTAIRRIGHCSTRAALIYLHSTSERQRAIADTVGKAAKAALRKAKAPKTDDKASGTKVARCRGTRKPLRQRVR
jgi:hypothetical protein